MFDIGEGLGKIENSSKNKNNENRNKNEVIPNRKQQNKIIAFFERGKDIAVFENKSVELDEETREKFLEKIANGEIEENDFKELLEVIQMSINPEMPAILFRKTNGNKQMEKMIAYLVLESPDLNDFSENGLLNTRNAEKFLTDYSNPFLFEEKIAKLLQDIKNLNTVEKYEQYRNSKEELMRRVYGKRYEYYKQIELLKKEAEEKYLDKTNF